MRLIMSLSFKKGLQLENMFHLRKGASSLSGTWMSSGRLANSWAWRAKSSGCTSKVSRASSPMGRLSGT